jgi:hypothetical protein
MFIEENKAANVEVDDANTLSANQGLDKDVQPTSPVESITETQAFAKRLKEEKAKAKKEALEDLAQSFGYSTYDEYLKAQTDTKLIDKGFDPDKVRPVIEDLIQKDPRYIAAIQKAQEYEALEKELFAKNSIETLNATFGTNYKSINELDPETIRMWNEGTPIEKAFAANNYDKIRELTLKTVKNASKDHLKDVAGNNIKTETRIPTDTEIKMFKILNPGITDEQIKAFLNPSTK